MHWRLFNLKKIGCFIIFELYNLLISFCCYLFFPMYHSIYKDFSFIFLGISIIGIIFNIFFIKFNKIKLFVPFKKYDMPTKKFLLSFVTIFFMFLFPLLCFVSIKIFSSNSFLLKNGLESIILVLIDCCFLISSIYFFTKE